MNTRALNFSKGPMSRHLFRGLEQGLEEERRTPRFLPVYCEADHNNCLSASPSRALCLGTPRLRRVPYFQPSTASHFSSFHLRSFSSSTLLASWEVRIWVRDVP